MKLTAANEQGGRHYISRFQPSVRYKYFYNNFEQGEFPHLVMEIDFLDDLVSSQAAQRERSIGQVVCLWNPWVV